MTQKPKKNTKRILAILLSVLLCAQIPTEHLSITAYAAPKQQEETQDEQKEDEAILSSTIEQEEVQTTPSPAEEQEETETDLSPTQEDENGAPVPAQTQEEQIDNDKTAAEPNTESTTESTIESELNSENANESETITESETIIETAAEIAVGTEDKAADVIMTFCGIEITGSTSGDGWTYDRQSQSDTLTLDNFSLTDTNVNFIRTKDDNDLTIFLKGDNIVQTSGGFFSGIPYPETVTITGEADATLSFKSIDGGGFFMPQNLIIKDGVRVNFDTTQHVWPNRDLTIDNAELNVQCNGKASYLYINQGSLIVKNHSKLTVTNTTPDAVCGIYMHQNMTIMESTVTVTNPNPDGLCIYMKYTTSNPPNPPITHNAYITNSTVEMNGGLLGMHCDKAEIKNSTIKTGSEYVYAIRAAIDEVKIDEDSTIADTMLSYYQSDTMHKRYVVYGNARLPQSFTIAEGETLTIPEGAALTLPEGVTLTNNGTMHIVSPKSLKGSGTLSGDGAFEMDMNADAVTVPDGLYWQEDITEKIKELVTVPETIPVCGKDFTVDYNETNWTTDYSWAADGLTCTVKYTRQSDNTTISKEIPIAKSAMVLTEKVNTYTQDGITAADTFAYGDTITVKATPAYQAADSGKTKTVKSAPTAGEMAVFYGDTQLSAPATADSSGTYTMQADTTLLPNNSLNDLLNKKKPFTVKFIGTETMTDAQADFDVTITADATITMPDKTTRYVGKLPDAFAAENNGATITLLRDVEGTVESGKFAFLELPIQSDQTGNSFTLELNGHTISSNTNTIYIGRQETLTITGIGTITGKINGIYVKGTADIQGGIIIGRNTGIYVQDATSLKISGNVEVRGDGYGLSIYGSNVDIALSGGTYTSNSAGIYWKARQDTPLNLLDLLDNTKDEKYAYFRGNQPITEGLKSIAFGTLQMAPLNKTVTINPCTDHVWSVEHITNTGTHNQTCKACALTETAVPCTYDYKGNETTQTGTCICGSTVEITLNGAQELVYDKTPHTPAVTVTRDGEELTAPDDYTLDYTDNTDAGTASVTIKGASDKNTDNIEKTMQFPIAPKPVTITNVTAQEREYDKTDIVQITAVTLAGVITDDAVAVPIPAGGLTGTLESLDAGHYTAVTLPENLTLSGTAKDNYTLTQPAGAVKTDITIRKAKGTLQLTDTSVIKTYGDPGFQLNYTTESDGKITYQVTGSKDTTGTPIADTIVINIEDDGTVSIKNAGTAVIKIFLGEGKNYEKAEQEAAVQITVNKAANPQSLPAETITVSENRKTVGDVPLPENWQWQDTDRETPLPFGTAVTATAVYTGADKDNYEATTQTITITKVNCTHNDTEIRDVVQPGCEHGGYSGDTYCKTCGDKIRDGEKLPALGHDYNDGEVTKEPTGEAEGEKTYTCKRCGNTYTETIPVKPPVEEKHEGLWISGLQHSVPYTGTAITQDGIKVYHNSTLLQEKTEYTLSYKNNKNAGTAQITVSGKGSYRGKATQTFTIEKVDLGRETQNNISAAVATATATGKTLKPAVTVTWNGKKLKEKKDYILSHDKNITTAATDGYDITISGTGNYTGSITRKFHVKPKGTPLLNSARVTGIDKSYPYQASEQNTQLENDLKNLTVKVGKTTLTQGIDYTVRIENADAAGTATLIIEAAQTSIYAGEKRIPIQITGTDLKKGSVAGLEKTYSYTGAPVEPTGITVFTGRNGTGTPVPADAYTVRYRNNTKTGKAAIIITGNPQKGYSGTLKAAYTIGRYDLSTGENTGTVTIRLPDAAPYAKGGAKPKPVITHTYNGTASVLRENIDYKLKYKNNTAVYPNSTPDRSAKQPAVTISGIGNYSGTVTKTYRIDRQNLNGLTIAVTDKPYNAKKKGSAYYAVPKVYDLDGRQLRQKTDYTVQYTSAATGQEISKTDTITNGTQIRVIVTAAQGSSYSGTLSAVYTVRNAAEVRDLAKTKADKIAPQQYSGAPICPQVRLYTKTGKTKTYLTEGEDYHIAGWYNNTQKGTATILIKGSPAGGYSGIKTVTFKITSADNNKIWSGAF